MKYYVNTTYFAGPKYGRFCFDHNDVTRQRQRAQLYTYGQLMPRTEKTYSSFLCLGRYEPYDSRRRQQSAWRGTPHRLWFLDALWDGTFSVMRAGSDWPTSDGPQLWNVQHLVWEALTPRPIDWTHLNLLSRLNLKRKHVFRKLLICKIKKIYSPDPTTLSQRLNIKCSIESV